MLEDNINQPWLDLLASATHQAAGLRGYSHGWSTDSLDLDNLRLDLDNLRLDLDNLGLARASSRAQATVTQRNKCREWHNGVGVQAL